eukprot:5643729-Pyramimonas_sp.AAC.1
MPRTRQRGLWPLSGHRPDERTDSEHDRQHNPVGDCAAGASAAGAVEFQNLSAALRGRLASSPVCLLPKSVDMKVVSQAALPAKSLSSMSSAVLDPMAKCFWP